MADNNIDPELIRELNEKYGQMRDAIATMIPAMVLSTTAINQMIAASKGLAVSEKDGTKVVDEFLNSVKKATTQNEAESEKKQQKAEREKQNTALQVAATTSLKQFGTALFSSASGMTKYGQSVTTATNAAGDFASNFGIWGKIIGGAIKVLGFFVDAVFKQNDTMIKSFDSLSEVGATSTLTTNDIRKLGLNAGYVGERLEIFSNITKGLGTDLLGLGTTAGKGVVEFSKVASVTQETRDSFNRLGIGQEELTKIQANYIKTTIASGRSLAQSPELLRKQSLRYATVLEELAAITGMNRDTQQKTLDEANANLNFQVHMYELGKKEAELRKQNTVDSIKQADAINRQIENTNAVVVVSKKMNSALDHTATLQLLAGKTWTESSAGLASKMPGLLKMLSRLDKGEDITVDFMDGMANSTEAMLKAAGGAIKIGEAGPEIAKALGISVESVKFLADYRSKDASQRKEALELIRKEIADRKENKGANDAAKNAQNEQLKTELTLQKAFDELTNKISGPVNWAFSTLMKTVMATAKIFAELSFKFGGADLRHLFKTPEELRKDVDDLVAETSKLEAALAKEVSLREAKIKNDEESNKKDKEYQEAKNKLNEIAKNRPTASSSAKDIESWQTQRVEQDKLVKKLEQERSVLITKGYQMKRELESRGMGPGAGTAHADRIRGELENKRGQLAQAKKYASDAGPTASEEDSLSKIRFKDRKENTGGGKADPALISMAERINNVYPNSTITAMNDVYHQNRRDRGGNLVKSKHTEGKALDFSMNPAPADADEAALVKASIKNLGASKVLDEYFSDKNDQTKGGHFHVEVARKGGLFKGPDTGYPVILHGEELITPMNKVQNVTKTEISSLPTMDSGSGSDSGESSISLLAEMIEMLSDKLDTMIDRLDTSNSIQDDLLKYSRV